jgi:pimeloyl-ACP methyl ester carboxylesterase
MLRSLGPELFGEQHGHAPARVLALPGWMRQRSDFRHVLDGVDAVALDLPGFGGATPEPPEPIGAAGYAELVAPALDACTERAVVLGHSFGGRVAVHLAARYPDRIGALVLTGVPLLHRDDRPSKAPLSFRVRKHLHRLGLYPDGAMERLRRSSGSADYRAATGVMREVFVRVVNESYEEQLQAVTQPVELVWGDDDDAVPLYVAERAAALLGGRARLTVVPGAGHLTPLTAVSALRDALGHHL